MANLQINFTVKANNENGREIQTVCKNMKDYEDLKSGVWKNFTNVRIVK